MTLGAHLRKVFCNHIFIVIFSIAGWLAIFAYAWVVLFLSEDFSWGRN